MNAWKEMSIIKKSLVVMSTVVIIMTLFITLSILLGVKDRDPTLNTIRGFSAIRNNNEDVLDDIGIDDISDVGFEIKGKKIIFTYGKHEFYILKKYIDEKQPQAMDDLKWLHLQCSKRKDGTYYVKYKGEKVQEWSTSDTYKEDKK